MIEKLGHESWHDRDLFLLHVASPEQVPRTLDLPSAHFVCLLLWDAATAPVAVVDRVATGLLEDGCVYVCTRGADCERVHDIFDEVIVGDGEAVPDEVVMTTWHDDESLADTLFFFLHSTGVDDAFAATCRAAIAIVVGDLPDELEKVRLALTQPEAFVAEWLAAGDAD